MKILVLAIVLCGCSGIDYDAIPTNGAWCCSGGTCHAETLSCDGEKVDEAYVVTFTDRRNEKPDFVARQSRYYCESAMKDLSSRDWAADVSACDQVPIGAKPFYRDTKKATVACVIAIAICALMAVLLSRGKRRKTA